MATAGLFHVERSTTAEPRAARGPGKRKPIPTLALTGAIRRWTVQWGGRATAMCTASWEAAASSTSPARAPSPASSCRTTAPVRGNRERVAPDAERERLILEWELGMGG